MSPCTSPRSFSILPRFSYRNTCSRAGEGRTLRPFRKNSHSTWDCRASRMALPSCAKSVKDGAINAALNRGDLAITRLLAQFRADTMIEETQARVAVQKRRPVPFFDKSKVSRKGQLHCRQARHARRARLRHTNMPATQPGGSDANYRNTSDL